MTNCENNTAKEFSFKERLTLTLLLAFAAPVMLFVTGAMDIYANNLAELEFVLADFILWNILFSLCASAIIIAILLPLKRRFFDYTFAVLFWLSFTLFLQGNYLNFGLGSLSGDGTSGATVAKTVINTVVWVIIGAGIVISTWLFARRHRGILKSVATVVLVTIIGLQIITTASLMLTTDIFMSHENRVLSNDEMADGKTVLSYKNLANVGSSRNVVYFVIDRFDYRFYLDAMEKCPEIFEELDGFTCYEDALALYPRTYPAVPYLITGVEQDFSMPREDYFDYAYENSEFLKKLSENGYKINIYSDIFYSYESAEELTFIANTSVESAEYEINDGAGLGMKLALVSLYRYLPYLAKPLITVGTGSFSSHVSYDSEFPRYTTDMRNLWLALTEDSMELADYDKSFSFIHFSGTHTPYLYDESFNKAVGSVSTLSATKQSFKIINRYLSEMKRLGVYEDSTVIITGDHASIGSDSDTPMNPHTVPILFKPSGSSDGFEKSAAPAAHENIIPSILKSEGMSPEGLASALGDIPENAQIPRRYYFQCRDKQASTKYIQYEYEIVGSARDYRNWIIKKQYSVGNIYS